jgi:hypothetical protein
MAARSMHQSGSSFVIWIHIFTVRIFESFFGFRPTSNHKGLKNLPKVIDQFNKK